MGKVSSKHVINRVHEMVADASKTPDPKGRVLLINMRCAPYNRHQNVTVHIMHQLIERVQNYNKTHDEKLYIRPLGAFTTHNTGSKESIDQIRLADFVTSYTRDNPGAPILPPIDFYGRLATLETTVDTRMTDPSSIMEFWRQASKEPKIAGVIGGRSGSLHIASYAFADPKKILAWDIPYAFNDPRLEHERNSENRHSFRHEDFVRFAMEYPILSIIPISNENKLSFTNDSLTLTDNFLAGRQPQSLTPAELRSYMGTSKNYLPYLRSSPSLQPPEDMKKAAGCVSIIGEDILSFFGKDKSRDREH
jgi:hypothetical protein